MLSMDPPEHTRLRGLMMKAFTARRIQLLRPGTERVTTELLDGIIAQGPPTELVSELCLPLPVMVICELLGVPYADRHLLQEWSTAFTSVTALTAEQVEKAYTSLREYVADLVAQRRRVPADDFLGALVEARDSGDRLSEGELVTMTVFLLVAGHETTATQLANSLFLLLDRPEELAKLRARPELMPTAVDELLRYIPIFASATLARVAVEDVEIGGVLIRRGDAVLVSDPAANWDEHVFTEPDKLDFTRSPNPHMAFGHGAHRCLGSQLARMELQVALRAVADRFEGLRLAVDPNQVRWKSGKTTHGVAELPVAWMTPATADEHIQHDSEER
jgi:cytochrome P450